MMAFCQTGHLRPKNFERAEAVRYSALEGEQLWKGGYPERRVLRLAVGSALALRMASRSLVVEAEEDLCCRGLNATSWQDGLLEWLTAKPD
jgi:hypothetical protein